MVGWLSSQWSVELKLPQLHSKSWIVSLCSKAWNDRKTRLSLSIERDMNPRVPQMEFLSTFGRGQVDQWLISWQPPIIGLSKLRNLRISLTSIHTVLYSYIQLQSFKDSIVCNSNLFIISTSSCVFPYASRSTKEWTMKKERAHAPGESYTHDRSPGKVDRKRGKRRQSKI